MVLRGENLNIDLDPERFDILDSTIDSQTRKTRS